MCGAGTPTFRTSAKMQSVSFFVRHRSFFKGAKNREIQKTEKMDLRHLIFWGCLKSAIFGGKPMPTRPPLVRGPEDCRLKRSGESVFPWAKTKFPLGEFTFPLAETKFPLGELTFPLAEIRFLLGDLTFPLAKRHGWTGIKMGWMTACRKMSVRG